MTTRLPAPPPAGLNPGGQGKGTRSQGPGGGRQGKGAWSKGAGGGGQGKGARSKGAEGGGMSGQQRQERPPGPVRPAGTQASILYLLSQRQG